MKENLNTLVTEQRNESSMHIDSASTMEALTIINDEDQKVALAVQKVLPNVAKLIDVAHENMKHGGRIIYMGAGTSGRLGVLDASECPPTYGVSFDLVQGLMAGGYEALLKAKEGAEDSQELGKQDLQNLNLTKHDTVIGLAASGRTPYVIGGLQYAKEIGATTGSICCVDNATISSYATYPIEVNNGPEVITGSTRMKSATSQKLILNMISTILMVKYGKVFQNLMVDVQPTNEKLVERAKRIIMTTSSCSYDEAAQYLIDSDKNVKVAICMAITKKDKATCNMYLDKHAGNVAKTIHELQK